MQNKKIDLIKDDITAKLFEELIRSKWEIEVMGKFFCMIYGYDKSKYGGAIKCEFMNLELV